MIPTKLTRVRGYRRGTIVILKRAPDPEFKQGNSTRVETPRNIFDPQKTSHPTMKSAVIAATCLATASAFAPPSGAGRSATTSLSATEAQIDFFGLPEPVDFSQEVGAMAPLGFFDPVRNELGDVAFAWKFDDLRIIYLDPYG